MTRMPIRLRFLDDPTPGQVTGPHLALASRLRRPDPLFAQASRLWRPEGEGGGREPFNRPD